MGRDGDDLAVLDSALMDLRRFTAAPRVLDDQGQRVELSTLLVLHSLPLEGESVRGIAERLDVAPSTASRFVSRAERAGMVTRAPSSHDARQMVVLPTEVGLTFAERAGDHRRRRLASIVDTWDPSEVHHLASALSRFAADTALEFGGM